MSSFDLIEIREQDVFALLSASWVPDCLASVSQSPQSQIQGHFRPFGCAQLWFWPYSWIREGANSLSLPSAVTPANCHVRLAQPVARSCRIPFPTVSLPWASLLSTGCRLHSVFTPPPRGRSPESLACRKASRSLTMLSNDDFPSEALHLPELWGLCHITSAAPRPDGGQPRSSPHCCSP